jgi:hypothetical protein
MYKFTPDISLPQYFYMYILGPKLISTLLLCLVVVVVVLEHLHQPLQGVQIHPVISEIKL